MKKCEKVRKIMKNYDTICPLVVTKLLPFSFSLKRGRERKGPPEIITRNFVSEVADFESRFPYDSYGKNRAPFWAFFGEGFWGNIRRPLLLPAPLFYCRVLSKHSDTQAGPAFHCIRMFKGILSTRALLKRTDALSTND